VVKVLLEREDVDPNHLDNHDRTPLGRAAISGHEGIVNLLQKRDIVIPNHRCVWLNPASGGLLLAYMKELLMGHNCIDPMILIYMPVHHPLTL